MESAPLSSLVKALYIFTTPTPIMKIFLIYFLLKDNSKSSHPLPLPQSP